MRQTMSVFFLELLQQGRRCCFMMETRISLAVSLGGHNTVDDLVLN
jgi:hypothetical protein